MSPCYLTTSFIRGTTGGAEFLQGVTPWPPLRTATVRLIFRVLTWNDIDVGAAPEDVVMPLERLSYQTHRTVGARRHFRRKSHQLRRLPAFTSA